MTTEHGYLVLADISGYTAYLAGVELDHAYDILTDVLETIVKKLRPTLTLVKLEGDAVFAYSPESKLERGETLLELVEATYQAFRERREGIHRQTSCDCRACRAIPTLDLKFFVHLGDYIVQHVAGISELVGSDVNLVHRLMKNHVTEATGWKAYALFTEAGLAHMGLRPAGLHEQLETYEHLEPVATYSLNLHERYRAIIEARRVVITPEQADLVIVQDLPAPITVVWDWINNPRKRVLWDELDQVVPVLRPGGRTSAGARNHCLHGKEAAVEDILDWRPFDYFTVQILKRGIYASRTCVFESLADGKTRLTTNFVVKMPFPDWLTRRMARPFLQLIGIPRTRAHMAQLVGQEAGK
jgi:hypothetical protein